MGWGNGASKREGMRTAQLPHRHRGLRSYPIQRLIVMESQFKAGAPPLPQGGKTLAIETRQLTRYFGDFCAVAGIDLAVERGTFYGFLGPNGAGKSTTIKMLTGLLAPSSGDMRVLGMNM